MLSFIVALVLCPPALQLVDDRAARRQWRRGREYFFKASAYLGVWLAVEAIFSGVYLFAHSTV